MAKNTYVVEVDGNVEEVTTIKEVSALLGTKVTKKAIENGDFPNVSITDEEVSTEDVLPGTEVKESESTIEDVTQEDVDTEDYDKVAEEVGDMPEDDTALTNTEEPVAEEVDEPEDIEFPEVGDFKDVKAIKKYIKKLEDEQLYAWCELEGATWKHNDHDNINRMRAAMAIKALHFPETKSSGKAKKKSKYSDYSTEDLVKMALEHDVEVKDSKGDDRIERMYTIIALREAGLLA